MQEVVTAIHAVTINKRQKGPSYIAFVSNQKNQIFLTFICVWKLRDDFFLAPWFTTYFISLDEIRIWYS